VTEDRSQSGTEPHLSIRVRLKPGEKLRIPELRVLSRWSIEPRDGYIDPMADSVEAIRSESGAYLWRRGE
jgi:hypothetical protein